MRQRALREEWEAVCVASKTKFTSIRFDIFLGRLSETLEEEPLEKPSIPQNTPVNDMDATE